MARRPFPAPLIHVGGTLSTPRLDLEPLDVSHAAPLFEGFANPRLYTWIHVDPPADVEDLRQRFERIANPYAPNGEMWLNWAVRLRESGTYVGLIEATIRRDRVAFLAFFVFPPNQRKGIGREACDAVLEHLWRAYDVVEVRCETDYRNVPARCLAEALGFVRRTRVVTRILRGAPKKDYRYRLKRPTPQA